MVGVGRRGVPWKSTKEELVISYIDACVCACVCVCVCVYAHIYNIYIYIHMCVSVCVCVCVYLLRMAIKMGSGCFRPTVSRFKV